MNEKEIIEDLRVLIRIMMKAKGSEQYDLKIEGETDKGDNFAGKIIFFSVSCSTGKTYNLVFKTRNRYERMNEMEDDMIIYRKEIHMYKEVFPILKAFCKEVSSSIFLDNVAKPYCVCEHPNHESLILENLKADGYRLWNRTKPMNLDHVLLVLENYGKFHAVSLALRTQKPDQFRKLMTEAMDKKIPGEINSTVEMVERDFSHGVKTLKQYGKNDLADKFQTILENLRDVLVGDSADDDKLVITHGDCWGNNFMFKYEDDKSSKPIKMCFLDFQFSHLESPVRDLSLYLYTSCDESTLKHFDLLLKTYYDSFSFTLRNLGSNPEDLFTMDQLKEHWKKYSIYGLAVATLLIKLQLSCPDKVPDSRDLGKDGQTFADWFEIHVQDEGVHERRLLDVFTHYADTCL